MHGFTWCWNRRRRWHCSCCTPPLATGSGEKKQWPHWFWPPFLASSCFLLFSFPPSLFCFLFPFFSFHSNEQKLLLFSAFYMLLPLFSFRFSVAPSFPSSIVCISVEIMREMAMRTCYAGWVHAPASMFFLLSTVLLSALSLVTLPSFLLFSVLLPFFFFFFLLSPQVSKGFI